MTWKITSQLTSVDGVPVGTPYGGGYVAGFISHTANGVPTHALIVAPRATGATGTGYTLTTNLQWKTSNTTTTAPDGGWSVFDGRLNTNAIIAAGINDHPAAKFCVNLSIGGFTDWYLPARAELDIAYFSLKPTTDTNNTSSGTNIYAVPGRSSNYTAGYPLKTTITAFDIGAESFVSFYHWTSNDFSNSAWSMDYRIGQQISFFGMGKTDSLRVRAFRRIAL